MINVSLVKPFTMDILFQLVMAVSRPRVWMENSLVHGH